LDALLVTLRWAGEEKAVKRIILFDDTPMTKILPSEGIKRYDQSKLGWKFDIYISVCIYIVAQ